MSEVAALSAVDRPLRRDTLIVTVCTLFSRVTGFGRVLATAAVLGSGPLGDVYQTANLLPNLVFELAAGGVLQAILVPAFVAARRADGVDGLARSASALAGQIIVGLGLLTVGFMLLAPLLARAIIAADPSSASRADKLDVLVPMLLVFLPQIVCYGLGALAAAALAAQGRFVAASLAPAVNNLIVIGACVWFRAARDGAVADLELSTSEFLIIAGGTTLGVLAFSLVPSVVLRLRGIPWRPKWDRSESSVIALRREYRWAALSVLGTFLPTVAALALGNAVPGGVAIFIYAFAFFSLPHALVAVPVATTLSPRVAEHWQRGDRGLIRRDLAAGIDVMIPLLALAAAGMMALAWPVARAFAFGQIASQGLAPIAHALAGFGPGLLAYGFSFLMVRMLLAVDDVRQCALLMVRSGAIGVLVMTLTATVVPDADRPMALAIGYGLAQGIAAWMLMRRFDEVTGALDVRVVVRALVESVVAACAAAVVMALVVSTFGAGRRAAVAALVIGGAAGVAAFAAVLAALRGGRMRRPRLA